jgi:hypothetical protein
MRNSLSYYLASVAVVLAVLASPAFAHVHHHHRGFYRHHLAAAQQDCGGFLGVQFPCPFGAAAPAPQPSLQAPATELRLHIGRTAYGSSLIL